MEPDVVWIAEDFDADDPFLLTGRFSGYLDGGGAVREEFAHLTSVEAIAWGRARADCVLIRLGDSGYYSAGSENPDALEYPDWPPRGGDAVEARRLPGYEALDNSAHDPPVVWEVDLTAPPFVRAAAFERAIRAHPEARPLAGAGRRGRAVRIGVTTSTAAQAWDAAGRVYEAASAAAQPGPVGRARLAWRRLFGRDPGFTGGYGVTPYARN